MGRLKRYLNAYVRHHRSRGFGVHSPYAYKFVREVLGQRLPYYSYDQIDELRRNVVRLGGGRWKRQGVMSAHDAKLLFRITNHFNPKHILQVGAGHGLATASMMAVSSTSQLWLHDLPVDNDSPSVALQVTAPLEHRLHRYTSLEEAIVDYSASLEQGERPYVYITSLPQDSDPDILLAYFKTILASRAVVVMRGLHRDERIQQLWQAARQLMPKGQTYSNDKTAILLATPRLQREHFALWL